MSAAAAPTVPPVAEAGAAVPPAAPAAPSPQYTPPPAPAPAMENGGSTERGGGKIKEFFSDINVVDVTVSAFIVAAVLYSIQYHKYMMMLEKTGYADLSTRVQKIESAMAAAKKKAESNAAGNGTMRKKRALMSL